MNETWNYIILNNTVKDWAICLSIIIVTFFLLRLTRTIALVKLKKLAQVTSTTLDDFFISLVQISVMPLLYILTVYFGLRYLTFNETVTGVMHVALLVSIVFFVVRGVSAFIKYTFNRALTRHGNSELREKQGKGILLMIQIAVWLVGILFVVNNLGYNITTLIAGLGIGGIAIALAAQTILGDLFSYIVIFFDKPFELGDFIIVNDDKGTVEYIGIKTTRIRTLNGEQLVCSNTDLTNSRVHNYKRMEERRIDFKFGVVYDTPAEKLKRIPGQVKDIIEDMDGTRFDRAHFQSFGDFSLDFEVVYYVLSSDYNNYMDIQQEINFRLFECFEDEQVEFAFPTQTLYVNRVKQQELEQA